MEHWLNGEKVVEYELGSPEWGKRVAASKFAKMPRYGTRRVAATSPCRTTATPSPIRNIRSGEVID